MVVALVPPRVVDFSVEGLPVPQGSVTAFIVKGRAVVTHKNASKLKPWRKRIAEAARAAADAAGVPLLDGAVVVEATFYLPQESKAAQRRVFPIALREGDVDKLLRGLLDGLTKVLYTDDVRVQRVEVEKLYGAPGVVVRVSEKVSGGVVLPADEGMLL